MSLLLITCIAAISYTPRILDKKHLFTSIYLGQCMLLISLFTLTSVAAGWIPVNTYTIHMGYAAALLHVLAVSVVLAQRINVFTENEDTITKQLAKPNSRSGSKTSFWPIPATKYAHP
jgi:hypothetical protein